MKLRFAFLPVLAMLLAGPLYAKDAPAPPRYFDPATVDYKTLLPNPPANDSAETHKEIDLILEEQKNRTPEDVIRITREAKHLDIFLADTVVGPWFTAKNLPVTATLFRNVGTNVFPVVDGAKKYWDRPRPFALDPRVKPPIDLPKNPAYPSGHSTAGNLDALILAEIAPDLKEALMVRGKQIGEDRVMAGVHYPSDVQAGHLLAQDLFAKLMASPVFQADLAQAKAEFTAVRAQH
jgi:acid phosphatase (class A)